MRSTSAKPWAALAGRDREAIIQPPKPEIEPGRARRRGRPRARHGGRGVTKCPHPGAHSTETHRKGAP